MAVSGSGVSFWGGENVQALDTVTDTHVTL